VTPTESAILRTVLYGDVFNFALTVPEIHHFLIADAPIPYPTILNTLETSTYLKSLLTTEQGYVVCNPRLELIRLRQEREQVSAQLWAQAQQYGVWLSRLPFVRMVALTGALAIHNPAGTTDDLDYLLVTTPNRVWLARACSILLVRWVKRRGIVICPNYVLATTALEQGRRDLFMAREIAQMIPLYDTEVYTAMRAANCWVSEYLPNANAPYYPQPARGRSKVWDALKRLAETLLSGAVGNTLERWEFERKARRFAQDLRLPSSAAQIDAEHVKGHFNDHGHPILEKYRERLRRYQLDAEALPIAGD